MPLFLALFLQPSGAAPSRVWEQTQGARYATVLPGAGGKTGFALLPPEATGVLFTNVLAQSRYTTNQIYLNGSGVAAGDVDGDGWCDLYFCGLDRPNALYRNLGNWRFEEITREAGVACENLNSTGAAFADIDGDGNLDLIVNSIGGGTHIFRNDGRGRFTETQVLNPGHGGMSLALADIDGDGALDLYICNYRPNTLRDQPQTNFRINLVNGKPVVALVNGQPATTPELRGRFTLSASGNIAEHGEADALYHNDGHGHFSPIPFTGGAFLDEDGKPIHTPPYDWGLSVMFRDLNGDGAPDIYVCNDFESVDRIWMNDGHGTFRALPRLALRNTSKFSMGMDVADINRDGYDDLLVLDMLSRHHITRLTRADKSMEGTPIGGIDNRPQLTRNTLQLNRGDGTYAEIAYFAGLAASEWSWTPIFLDVDLDGFEDLLVTTGHGRDDMDIDNGLRIEHLRRARKMAPLEELALRKSSPPLPAPKLAFRNLGNLRFEEIGAQWGFDQVGISHGMCLADLDNDGDLDVIVNNLNGAAGLYRNETDAPRLAVRLKGAGTNTRGIGAKIRVRGGAVPMQSQEVLCGGRYLSSDDPMRAFAAGSVTNHLTIEVAWRDGKQSSIHDVIPNRIYEMNEAENAEPLAFKVKTSNPAPLFEDVSALLGHEHHDEAFDDFARQALLPNRLSQLGPGIGWADLNGDGLDDLVIGSGKGGTLAVFENTGTNAFRKVQPAVGQRVTRDQTAVVALPENKGSEVLIGAANYEDGLAFGSAVRMYNPESGTLTDLVPAPPSSTGPLALADIDGDGDLDLFVGGRVLPGRYPEPASSLIFENREGKWLPDEPNSALLKEVGLVSGALWSDLNGDGYPELVLACEWGPVKIFQNDKGHLREATRAWGMDKKVGWWNGLAAGDFDGDGRMDLVAANWGLNTKYQLTAEHGPRIYYGAWGNTGEIEPLEASFDPELNAWVPERDFNSVGRAIPFVHEKFRSHRQFAEGSIEMILGEHLKEARVLEVNWLQTTVFLNRGDHFEIRALPAAAQFSPAFGVNVADFDGDGIEDIFLSQNFFAVQPLTSRNDAGRGLLLRGKGSGTFEAISGPTSGIEVYGEQRGSAVADYDGDGRVDLAVTQNGAATKLYRNLRAKPGLRVRLNAGGANPQGIGAIVRLGFGERWGPAREVHAGSGYWSQDSPVQVLATPATPAQIQVQWPGGKKTVSPISGNLREISVGPSGAVKVTK